MDCVGAGCAETSGAGCFCERYFEYTQNNNFHLKNRKEQSLTWMFDTIKAQLMDNFLSDKNVLKGIKQIETRVMSEEISSYAGAKELLNKFHQNK